MKIIAEHKLPISLNQLTNDSYEAYRGSAAERKFSNQTDHAAALRGFFRERVEF